jgi:hypothetical protein
VSNSLVDPSAINSSFPLAGQNNPSQGFRDNFAAIKNALNRTKVELTELRSLSVLKSALPNTVLENDMSFTPLFRAQLQSHSDKFYNHGTVSTTVVLDFFKGNFQKVTTAGDLTVALSNFPIGSQVGKLILWVSTTAPNHKIYVPVNVTYGITNNFMVGNAITFPTAKDYLIEFTSVDSGVNFWITAINGLQEFASGGGASGATPSVQLPKATNSEFGIVRPDGSTIIANEGVLTVVGVMPAPSDQRLKSNISTISNALDAVDQLRGVTYTMNGTAGIGVIAQELEQVYPELVTETADGYRAVYYANMAGVFIECIKELRQEISQLKTEIAQLKNLDK